MVLAVANDSMQGFSCWLPRLTIVGIGLKWSRRSIALLYGRISSGVLVLVEIRAVVAGVQPAVEPVRVSPQDVAARLPAACGKRPCVRRLQPWQGRRLFMLSDEDLAVERHQNIMFSVLDEMALDWRGSIDGPRDPSL